ncbi:hypothetical protein ACIQUX_25395 [Streptomyces sp. NPDC101133]|uniref:hypothetical protein n=1 Tax=Streptomyces sp. NPDC101133 TaxID=3366111 RepID=UPI0037F44731
MSRRRRHAERAHGPAAVSALRPGGRLAFSILAHHLGGAPAHPAVQHTEIGARTPDGEVAGMRRWVLQEQVWAKLLDSTRARARPAGPDVARSPHVSLTWPVLPFLDHLE